MTTTATADKAATCTVLLPCHGHYLPLLPLQLLLLLLLLRLVLLLTENYHHWY